MTDVVPAATSKPKESRFDPSRLPASPKAHALVDEVRRELLRYEDKFDPRIRKRRAVDQSNFDRMVAALVCDLIHAALLDPESWRHISLSKRQTGEGAVGACFMTAERSRILEWMASPELTWIEMRKGEYSPFGGRQTTIRASQRLRWRVDTMGLDFGDLGRDLSLMGDPIVLRGNKVRGKAKNMPVPTGEPVATYRVQMERINRWLANADIACDHFEGKPRDAGDRWLRRIFNDGRMDQGGRLYGGFWQNGMGKEARLQDILLNGEPVACLDYGQCGIRIAYGLVGAEPPPGDLYCVPGLEGYRKGVKTLLNAQLAREGEMRRLPTNTRKHFSEHITLREIEELILRHHHPLREQFYSGQGKMHQFIESEVLVRCLLRLIDMGLVALPIHDGLLVPQSCVADVGELMKTCFKEVTSVDAVVSVSTTDRDEVLLPSAPGVPLVSLVSLPGEGIGMTN